MGPPSTWRRGASSQSPQKPCPEATRTMRLESCAELMRLGARGLTVVRLAEGRIRREDEGAEVRARVREGGPEGERQHVARLLGVHDGVDEAARAGVARVELCL